MMHRMVEMPLKTVTILLALRSLTALIDVNSVNPVATLVILIIFSWVTAIQLNK